MRSRPDAGPPRIARQRGFSLMEVMVASTILSIFILGLSGFWYQTSRRAAELVQQQKAIFVLNAEVERISALYIYTNFAASPANGPVTTTGYTGLAALPATRLTYPGNLNAFTAPGADFVTNSANAFRTGSEFMVWLDANLLPALNRTYVWIDRNKSVVGRLSWVTTDIDVASCIQTADCSCQRFDNGAANGGRCRKLDVFLEYPYRFVRTGSVVAPTQLQTLSVATIVGRG